MDSDNNYKYMTEPSNFLAQNGHVVLVTGGAKRLGKAIVWGLATRGYRVGIHTRHGSEDATALMAEIHTRGGSAFTVHADLSDPVATAALIPRIVADWGPLFGLVNNAAHFVPDAIQTLAYEEFRTHMDVNLFAPLLLSRHFAEAHFAETSHTGEGKTAKRRANQGAIVNLLDYCVKQLPQGFTSYTLSKTGLWTATQQLATMLAPMIRVNAIAPGFILPHKRLSEARFSQCAEENLLEKAISATDVANMVVFLLETPIITGQMLTLDGGRHLMRAEYPVRKRAWSTTKTPRQRPENSQESA